MFNRIRLWQAAHPNLALTFVTLAALAPFIGRPFNVDDPLFVWCARQIHLHPGNPFGFPVNWAQTVFPMWNATDNPPLACYYLALAAVMVGWSEIALHLACLLPALAVVLGTRRLATRFCTHPNLAALAALFTPVFLVSGSTVMCDMLMLAFWVWAAVFWVEGTERKDFGWLAVSGLLISLAELTKYYGACLIPLLGAYSLLVHRRPGRWLLYLLIPLVALYGYQVATLSLYGHNLLLRAVQYTSFFSALEQGNPGGSGMARGLTALTFTGGCVAATTFFAPLLWSRWKLAGFGSLALLAAGVLVFGGGLGNRSAWDCPAGVKLQVCFWVAGGIGVLMLALSDLVQRRNTAAWFLALWVCGTFIFTAGFNWTVNGRSILPMAPAVGILLARRLEQNFSASHKVWSQGAVACLAVSAALAWLVAWSDFQFACAARESARETCAKWSGAGKTLWFEGHWGFQYYMEADGARAIDLANPALEPGDVFAEPANNTGLQCFRLDRSAPQETVSVAKCGFLTTVDETVGAGFYASITGPLPFAFGRVPPERVAVFSFSRYISEPEPEVSRAPKSPTH